MKYNVHIKEPKCYASVVAEDVVANYARDAAELALKDRSFPDGTLVIVAAADLSGDNTTVWIFQWSATPSILGETSF